MAQPFFPTIGSLATRADELPEHPTPDSEQTEASTNDERPLHEIESLCMKCGEQVSYFHTSICFFLKPFLRSQGMTRMLLTSIPYFHEVIVASFRCEHCGNTNNEIQSAGEIRRESEYFTLIILFDI